MFIQHLKNKLLSIRAKLFLIRAYEKLHGQTVEGSELKVEFYMEQHRPNRVVNRNSRGTFRPPNFSGGSASPMRTTDFPLR